MTVEPPDGGAGPGQDPRPDDLAEAEARLESAAPGYLGRVREAAGALRVGRGRGSGLVGAVGAVRETAALDLEAPTASATAPGKYVKVAVKRLTTWYLHYLTVQVAAFAEAVASMSEALVTRLDELDAADGELAARVADLDGRLADLDARLEQLEQGAAASRRSGR